MRTADGSHSGRNARTHTNAQLGTCGTTHAERARSSIAAIPSGFLLPLWMAGGGGVHWLADETQPQTAHSSLPLLGVPTRRSLSPGGLQPPPFLVFQNNTTQRGPCNSVIKRRQGISLGERGDSCPMGSLGPVAHPRLSVVHGLRVRGGGGVQVHQQADQCGVRGELDCGSCQGSELPPPPR